VRHSALVQDVVVTREEREQRGGIEPPRIDAVDGVNARLVIEIEVDVEADVEPLERLEHACCDVQLVEDLTRRLRRDQIHDPHLLRYG
jgi:hypothetical protein